LRRIWQKAGPLLFHAEVMQRRPARFMAPFDFKEFPADTFASDIRY
jgi:hypothetical protein